MKIKSKKVNKSKVLILIQRALIIERKLKDSPIEMIKNNTYEDIFINSKHYLIGK